MQDRTIIKLFGMGCLVVSYAIAAQQGYNGWLFTTVVVILGSAMGIEVGYLKGKKVAT